jgi:type IX secretion system PorP/SprF family membrane protein
MMRFLLIFMLFITLSSSAQDVHFSQYSITKSGLNPAFIGYQGADFQFQLQRRSQWESVTTPFTTFSMALNGKELFKQFSLGIQFMNDLSGDSHFSTSGLALALSNKLNLSSVNNISFGASIGSYQRSLDYSSLTFIDDENFPNQGIRFFDISLGVINEWDINSGLTLLSGISIFHINNPNQSLLGSKEVKLNTNNKIHTSLTYYINDKLQVKPSVYYSGQGKANELLFGAGINYLLANYTAENIVLRASIFDRYNDAIITAFGVKIDNFDIMISYDINTSSLVSASDHKGGFEFAIVYQWNLNKIEKEFDRFVCPKYL